MSSTKHAWGDLNMDIPRRSPVQITLSVQQQNIDQEWNSERQTFILLRNRFPRHSFKENALKLNNNCVWRFAVEGKDI